MSFGKKIRVMFAAMLTVLAVLPSAAWAWEYVGVIDGVKVWRKENPGTNLFSFKGEVTADVSIGKIMSVFLERDQRQYWVDRFDATKTLDKRGPLEEVYWIKFKLPIGISNRDYVLHAKGTADAASGVFKADIKSVTHPSKPADDCCVRGEARGTYYRFEAVNGKEQTKLTVEVSTDPKGLLPGWLVNAIQKGWPSKTLNGLVRQSKKLGKEHPDYAGWHARQ